MSMCMCVLCRCQWHLRVIRRCFMLVSSRCHNPCHLSIIHVRIPRRNNKNNNNNNMKKKNRNIFNKNPNEINENWLNLLLLRWVGFSSVFGSVRVGRIIKLYERRSLKFKDKYNFHIYTHTRGRESEIQTKIS